MNDNTIKKTNENEKNIQSEISTSNTDINSSENFNYVKSNLNIRQKKRKIVVLGKFGVGMIFKNSLN